METEDGMNQLNGVVKEEFRFLSHDNKTKIHGMNMRIE